MKIVWECEINKNQEKTVNKVVKFLEKIDFDPFSR